MIQGKPIFEIRLDIERCPHDVYVNGGLVERNFQATATHIDYQVNHLLRSGRNDIEVHMIQYGDEPYECDVKVQLRHKDVSAPADAEPIPLLTLAHDARTAPADNLAQGSSPSGAHDSRTGRPAEGGDLRVAAASVVPAHESVQVLSRSFELPTPFPEWAFLRGDPLKLNWELADEAEEALAYRQLLTRYEELHTLLEKQDVDGFLDACEERSREIDLAYYKASGETRRGLDQQLRKAMTDPAFELTSLYKKPGASWGYMVGSKGTLALLTQGMRASPILRYQMKDGTAFSLVFPVMFRKDGKRFVVTR
jgi:hypothetical protein